MGKIKLDIQNAEIFYDNEFDVLLKDGDVCSGIPKETFSFKGKVYKIGTKVKFNINGAEFAAIYTKDADEYKHWDGGTAMPMVQAKEYYGDKIKLNEIFLELNCQGRKPRKIYVSNYEYSPSGIIEIVESVYYKSNYRLPSVLETAPVDTGYRTIESNSDSMLGLRYRNHLLNCITDADGYIESVFAPQTFGYNKHIYTTGTRVVFKHRDNIFKTVSYNIATFNGHGFDYCERGMRNMSIQDYHLRSGDKQMRKNPEIVCVIEPHYYRPEGHTVTAFEKFKMNGGAAPVDTSAGTILYIAVMIIGTIFKDRILIWIGASVVYFLWKYGYMNKK